ncbi:MAG TPA: hypothetical protein VMS75_09540 [Terriglobales bacterium]|nr:hypothetical protein [Terriglobales bacterium]
MNGSASTTDGRGPDYLVPALIAGAAAGVLSAVPLVNCLCCLWIIGGGVLAAYLLADRTPGSLTAGDGALVGALTGMAAAVVSSIIELPLRPFNEAFVRRLAAGLSRFTQQMPSQWRDLVERGNTPRVFSPGLFLLNLFITAAIFAALGVLGGVIGVSIFGRKKAPLPSPTRPTEPPQGPPPDGTV